MDLPDYDAWKTTDVPPDLLFDDEELSWLVEEKREEDHNDRTYPR
jgi:hypothetical protein